MNYEIVNGRGNRFDNIIIKGSDLKQFESFISDCKRRGIKTEFFIMPTLGKKIQIIDGIKIKLEEFFDQKDAEEFIETFEDPSRLVIL